MKSQNNENNQEFNEFPDNPISATNDELPVTSPQTEIDKYDDYILELDRHHYGHHKKKKMKKGKKIAISITAVILSLLIIMAGTFFIFNIVGKNSLVDNSQTQIITPDIDNVSVDEALRTVTYNGVTYTPNKNITAILAMGIDKTKLDTVDNAYGTAGQADVIIVFANDVETGVTKAINIPRDTIAKVNVYDVGGNFLETQQEQICLAYAYGDGKEKSCNNMILSVSDLLYGTKINSYLALDLESIPVINDSVGGIELTSLETVGNFVKGEKITLFGSDATSYIRTRDTTKIDSNLLRNKRQIQYIKAFSQKAIAKTKSNISAVLDLYNAVSPYMVTNIDAPKATFMATNAITKGFSDIAISSVPGTMKDGEPYAEFTPNEEEFYQLFLDTFYTVVK